MKIAAMFKNAEKFTVDNSPAILTAIGVTGTVTSMWLMYKSTTKATELLFEEDERKKIKGEGPLTNQEILKLTWKLYLPPALAGTLTVGAIISANRIGSKRAAAMAAAYTLSEKAYSEYKDKVVERIGARKSQAAKDEIAQDRVNANPVGKNEIYITGGGDVLCYDLYTGRYFQSSMETIKKAINDVNIQIINTNYASLNDFYHALGLAMTKIGEEMGWNLEKPLEVDFSTTMSDDQRPCIAIDYIVTPIRGVCRVQ